MKVKVTKFVDTNRVVTLSPRVIHRFKSLSELADWMSKLSRSRRYRMFTKPIAVNFYPYPNGGSLILSFSIELVNRYLPSPGTVKRVTYTVEVSEHEITVELDSVELVEKEYYSEDWV